MLIKEFLPNPAGSDRPGEYIKIFNNSESPVSLDGWLVKDASGRSFNLRGNLSAEEELILSYSQTKITLNNDGEKVFLYNADGKLTDEISYVGKAKEGQIITRSQEPAIGERQLELYSDPMITNYQPPITKIIFIDFLSSAILAGLVLYIILQLERKLDIKLW